MNQPHFQYYKSSSVAATLCPSGLLFYAPDDSSMWSIKTETSGKLRRLFDDSGLLQEFFQALRRKAQFKLKNAQTLERHWEEKKFGVSALNLNLTPLCNLACVYCYAKGGDYQRIQQEMAPMEAVSIVQEAFSHAAPGGFRIEFFGGEPLLNPKAIKAVLKWQEEKEVWKNLPDGGVNRISTNLSLTDQTGLSLLKKGKMIVSVSIDGLAETQNAQRPLKGGGGSFKIIEQNLEKLRKIYPDAVIVARITVFKQDVILLDTIKKLVSTDFFDFISLYPAAISDFPGKADGQTFFSNDFREQFLAFAREYPKMVGNGRFKGCLELNRYCEMLLTGKTVLNHCRAGSGYFTASADGSFHPCHRLVGNQEWDLRNFLWDIERLTEKLKPWETSVKHRPHCQKCAIRYLCGGGCKQQSLISSGDILGNDPRSCSFSFLLFEAASQIVCGIISAGCRDEENIERFTTALRASFHDSERLFVFCGQPIRNNGRSHPKEISFHFSDQIWKASSLHWE